MGKYNNDIPIVDGIRFDSRKEANYFCLLKMLKRGGVVREFERQVAFELQPKFVDRNGEKHRAINYKADFVVHYSDGRNVVVDVKGFRTKEYLLKRKLLLFKYPDIVFEEV